MPLNFAVVKDEDGEVYALVTKLKSGGQAFAELRKSGNEKSDIIDFISVKGDAADAISALSFLDDSDEGVGHALEKAVTSAFNKGTDVGRTQVKYKVQKFLQEIQKVNSPQYLAISVKLEKLLDRI